MATSVKIVTKHFEEYRVNIRANHRELTRTAFEGRRWRRGVFLRYPVLGHNCEDGSWIFYLHNIMLDVIVGLLMITINLFRTYFFRKGSKSCENSHSEGHLSPGLLIQVFHWIHHTCTPEALDCSSIDQGSLAFADLLLTRIDSDCTGIADGWLQKDRAVV